MKVPNKEPRSVTRAPPRSVSVLRPSPSAVPSLRDDGFGDELSSAGTEETVRTLLLKTLTQYPGWNAVGVASNENPPDADNGVPNDLGIRADLNRALSAQVVRAPGATGQPPMNRNAVDPLA